MGVSFLDLFSLTKSTISLSIFTDSSSGFASFFFGFIPQDYTTFHKFPKINLVVSFQIYYFCRMGLQEIRNLKDAAKLPKEKKVYYIPKISKKQEAKNKALKDAGTKPASKLELDVWFDNIRNKHWVGGFCSCMECGVAIPVAYSRHATAHLLPKKLFKSVATHELNYLILGAGCGCHYGTDRVDKFCQMKVWPEAARRIKTMIPLLPFDELKYLSGQLMTALENTPEYG